MSSVSNGIFTFGQTGLYRTENDYQALENRVEAVALAALAAGIFACSSCGLSYVLAPFLQTELSLASAIFSVFTAALYGTYYLLCQELRTFTIESPTLTSHPLDQGTAAVLPTTDSEETHLWRMRLIKNANHTIILSGNLCGDHSFDEVLDAINERLEAKPELKVVIMALPNFIQDQPHKYGAKNKARVSCLQETYPERFSLIYTSPYIFVNPGVKTSMNHCKCLVVDQKYVLAGGSSIRDHFVKPGTDQGEIKPTPALNPDHLPALLDRLETEHTPLPESVQQALLQFRDPNTSKSIYSIVTALSEHQELSQIKRELTTMLSFTSTQHSFLDNTLLGSFRDQDFVMKGDVGLIAHKHLLALAHRFESYNAHKPYNLDRLMTTPAFSGNQVTVKLDFDTVTTNLLMSPPPPLESITTHIPQLEADPRLADNVQLKILCTGPGNQKSLFAQETLTLIKEAEEDLVLSQQYFHPTNEIMAALKDAIRRGVRVTIYSNGESAISPGSVKIFGPYNNYCFSKLLEGLNEDQKALVSIYTFAQKNKASHKKILIADNKGIFGSSNLGYKGQVTSSDDEISFVFDSEELARNTRAICAEDIPLSKRVDNNFKLTSTDWGKALGYTLLQPFFG